MKTLLFSAAFAAAVIAPTAANAQALPAAVVAVVDLDKVTSDCNACKTAATTLRGQVTSLQDREKALADAAPDRKKSIQAAIDALKGKEPDAALQNRIKAFQTKQQPGAQEFSASSAIQRNQRYIQKQIQTSWGRSTAGHAAPRRHRTWSSRRDPRDAAAVDVTADVVAALNAALPTRRTSGRAGGQRAEPRGAKPR